MLTLPTDSTVTPRIVERLPLEAALNLDTTELPTVSLATMIAAVTSTLAEVTVSVMSSTEVPGTLRG